MSRWNKKKKKDKETGECINYLALQQKFEEQYGERTILVYAVGVFYETWEYDPSYCTDEKYKIDNSGKIWNEKIGHSTEVSIILDYELTFENVEKPFSIENPMKCGYPTIAYDKTLKKLLANDYTVIRMDQTKTNGKVTRFVTEICSPTLQIDTISLTRVTSNIATIYIEYQKGTIGKYENFLITTGVSVVDIITGENKICEFYSKIDDEAQAIQEIYRFLITHKPRELIIHIADMPDNLSTHSEESP